jgi:CheY-like chemotaxis protein
VSLIAGHLSHSGYETVTALNGPDALRLARSVRPYAITLDMLMTGMDGWEILQQLKKDPETADIPVIVVSLADNHETGIALGAVGIVEKPVNRDHLLNELNRLAGAGVRTVLVVDDCDYDRTVIAGLLKEVGLDVHLASSGMEALHMAREGLPDLITLDLVMPVMDGARVLEELRCDHGTAQIPVIIITSKDVSSGELERLSAGVSAILPKRGLDRKILLDELVCCLEKLGWQPRNMTAATDSRLLLVEDSEAAIIQVRFALESAGFTVDTVTGGRQALDYLKNHIPDGIVLDLMMPEVDGFAVLQAVRTSPLTSAVPVMVVTAKTLSPEEHRLLTSFNVRQVVQKGDVNQDELLTLVHEMLGTDRVFTDLAPMIADRRSVAPAPPTQQHRCPGSGAVLAIDDNRDNIEVVKAVLGKDFAVLEAGDGEEGLLLAQTEYPSVILLDMQLPKKDGMTLLRELKKDAATREIPVIAMTACAMAGDRERFLAAGCSEYLSKPYRIEDLESLVRRIVYPAGEC